MEKIPQENPKILKEKKWEEEKIIVDNITDRLGMHIDDGIKDTVIALRLLGFETTQSHEGKIDRVAYPYVDISTSKTLEQYEARRNTYKTQEYKDIEHQIDIIRKEINELQESDYQKYLLLEEEENKLFEKLDDLAIEDKIYNPEIDNDEDLKTLKTQIRKEDLETKNHLQILLDEFYQDKTRDDISLIVLKYSPFGITRISNEGLDLQETEQDEIAKKERLLAFQKEMFDFTEFLKRKYFEVS